MVETLPPLTGRSNPYISRIRVVQGDIAVQNVDALVSILPQNLEYKGAVNERLMEVSGAPYDEMIRDHVPKPRPGDVYALPPYNLPCRHVFFGVVPYWRTEFDRDDRHLRHLCRKIMEQAHSMSLKSMAFPPLATGKGGFPKKRAARLIVQGILDRLNGTLDEVRLVSNNPETLALFKERL